MQTISPKSFPTSLRNLSRGQLLLPSRRWYHQAPRPSVFRDDRLLPYTFIAICCGGCALGYYAQNQSQSGGDTRLLDLIHKHAAYSLANIREGRYYTMITSSFMHFSPIHLTCNMYGLYQLGPLMTMYFGPATFLVIWIGGSIACDGATLYWDSMKEKAAAKFVQLKSAGGGMSNIWRLNRNADLQNLQTHAIGIGASGSVLSMLAVFVGMMPTHKIMLFPVPLPMPAWIAALGFVAGSAYCLRENYLPAIGHAGHLGGLGFGLAYYIVRLRPWLRRFR
jgi:membrane associated rhomboid family serine protease